MTQADHHSALTAQCHAKLRVLLLCVMLCGCSTRKVVKFTVPLVTPPGVWLSWGSPLNSQYVIQGSTNLIDWYFATNVPIPPSRIYVQHPADRDHEFYRAFTALPQTDGTFIVTSITNLQTN
jgi:hypothetical protein